MSRAAFGGGPCRRSAIDSDVDAMFRLPWHCLGRAFAVLWVGALLVAGCDNRSGTKSAAPLPPPIFGQGTISGTVTLKGEPPAMRAIDNGICGPGAKPIREETVVVGPGGRLKNVVVSLKGVPASAPAQPVAPQTLGQAGCRYVPHVVAVQVGQKLNVTTADAVLHNVHAMANVNRAANLSMPPGSGPQQLTFDRPEVVAVRCDVHPWMLAYVAAFDHPFFAVTGDDGRFEIKGVPDGRYTLVAWHEALGELEQTVTVANGQLASAEFVYEKPE